MKLAWLLGLACANAACLRTTAFHCTSNAQCTSSGAGVCESVGYCSFADPSCADGRRFGELSDTYSSVCVGAGTIDAGSVDAASIDARMVDAAMVTIGGTVTGLTGTGLTLRNNATDELSVTTNGAFTFGATVLGGSGYAVTVVSPPTGQDAYVARGSGTANGPVTSVLVSCYAAGTDPGIRCDTGIFCTAGQVCCFNGMSLTGICGATGSQCAKVSMSCDSSAECGAGACCAQFHTGSEVLTAVGCVASSSQCLPQGNGPIEILCDARDASPCPGAQTCTGTSRLGAAYHACQ